MSGIFVALHDTQTQNLCFSILLGAWQKLQGNGIVL